MGNGAAIPTNKYQLDENFYKNSKRKSLTDIEEVKNEKDEVSIEKPLRSQSLIVGSSTIIQEKKRDKKINNNKLKDGEMKEAYNVNLNEEEFVLMYTSPWLYILNFHSPPYACLCKEEIIEWEEAVNHCYYLHDANILYLCQLANIYFEIYSKSK